MLGCAIFTDATSTSKQITHLQLLVHFISTYKPEILAENLKYYLDSKLFLIGSGTPQADTGFDTHPANDARTCSVFLGSGALCNLFCHREPCMSPIVNYSWSYKWSATGPIRTLLDQHGLLLCEFGTGLRAGIVEPIWLACSVRTFATISISDGLQRSYRLTAYQYWYLNSLISKPNLYLAFMYVSSALPAEFLRIRSFRGCF